jgi:hypothetical protein
MGLEIEEGRMLLGPSGNEAAGVDPLMQGAKQFVAFFVVCGFE